MEDAFLPDGTRGNNKQIIDCFDENSEIYEMTSFLYINNSFITPQVLKKIYAHKYLTSLTFTVCSFAALTEYADDMQQCSRLSMLAVIGCNLTDDQATLLINMAPFLQTIELRVNNLVTFKANPLQFLVILNLQNNKLEHIECDIPNLLMLDLSYNNVQQINYINNFSHLKMLDISNNQIVMFPEMRLYELEYINLQKTRIPFLQLQKLQPLMMLYSISAPQYDTLTIKKVRAFCMGELLSRQDEVSECAGKSKYCDKYEQAASYDNQAAITARLEAEGTLVPPDDVSRTAILSLLRQVQIINNKPINPMEATDARLWLWPEFLAVQSVMTVILLFHIKYKKTTLQTFVQEEKTSQEGANMEIFDTHCHISVLEQLPELPYNIHVKLFICSISASEFKAIACLQQQIRNNASVVGRGFGIHPHFAYTYNQSVLEQIQEYLQSVKTSFVGEIGIEQRQQYLEQNPIDVQLICFQELLELCFKYNKVASIHLVARKCEGYPNAHQLFMQVLKQIKRKYTTQPILILHSYSGSYEMLKQIIRLYGNVLIGVGHLNYNTKHTQHLMADDVFKHKVIFETDFYDPTSQKYIELLTVQQFVQRQDHKLLQLFIEN